MPDDPVAVTERLTARFAAENEAWTARHIALCQVAAPPYAEGPRAAAMADAMQGVGLVEVAIDDAGNVLGHYPLSAGGAPRLVCSAHLDTVFGPEVEVTVRRDGDTLCAPGIGDDTSGLVILLEVAAGLLAERVELDGDLWFAATVGEEGAGNLRGARHLAEHGVAGGAIDAFVTLDTARPGQVIRHGTHSLNHHLTLHGPGGHAWGGFGSVNPNLALARIVARAAEYACPAEPRTTLNCGLLHGGFAGNAIPESCSGHLNLRSTDRAELARLDAHVRAAIDEGVAAENARRQQGPELRLEHQITGRQGGETRADAPVVRAAVESIERRGLAVTHPVSSTDANAFMAVGIDAICIYRGAGQQVHTLDESYDAATRPAAAGQLVELVLRYYEK